MGLSILQRSEVRTAINDTYYIEVLFKDDSNTKTVQWFAFEDNGWLYEALTKSKHSKELVSALADSYITTYKNLDIIVFSGDTPTEAFEKQKFKLDG